MASNKERKKGTIAVVIVGRVITIERVHREKKPSINVKKNDNFCYSARSWKCKNYMQEKKNSRKGAIVKKIKEKTDST